MQYDIDGGNITVIVGEEVRIDVPTTLNYIKSGQAEISAAVDAGIEAYNSNATDKTTAFNNNATDKTNAFNLNASNKTGDFNDNYTLKKAAVDASADAAAASATLAQQWAVKMDGKVADEDYSAKYYADLAAQSAGATGANTDLSNLTPTGEAKFTAKQDVISDLSDIRSGAALGATAVQPADLSNYALDNAVVHLAGTETITGEKTVQDHMLLFKTTATAYNETPTANQYAGYSWKDKNGDEIAAFYSALYTSGLGIDGGLSGFNLKNKSGDTAIICLRYDSYGTFFANSPEIRPNADNTQNLGIASLRWKQLYAGTTTIATSDERVKQGIESVPDAVLDAWGDVEFYSYKFNDAIAEKGFENARYHTGMVAQRIRDAFTAHGLDATKYGLLCYDEWEAQPAEVDEHGKIIRPAQAAGNRYSLRYEECLCMEAAYQRRRADRIEARLAALEARL